LCWLHYDKLWQNAARHQSTLTLAQYLAVSKCVNTRQALKGPCDCLTLIIIGYGVSTWLVDSTSVCLPMPLASCGKLCQAVATAKAISQQLCTDLMVEPVSHWGDNLLYSTVSLIGVISALRTVWP